MYSFFIYNDILQNAKYKNKTSEDSNKVGNPASAYNHSLGYNHYQQQSLI